MGCENQTNREDLEIITSSGTIGDLRVTKVPPPEVVNSGYNYIPLELKQNKIK